MNKIHIFIVLLLGLQLFFLANLQFTAWPEMFSYAYLRNNDFLIYKDMIHPYPPLLTIALSWIYLIFGYHLWVLQAAAWVIILASSALVFFIAREITKSDKYALASLVIYVFLQPFLEGNMLWFDLAIMPSLLLSLLFLLRQNLFLAGLFMAATMLIKQTTGLYLIFSILYLVFSKKLSFNQLKIFLYGPLILGLPLLVRLIQEGALMDFINWVFVYPLTKWGSIIGYVQMEMSIRQIMIILLLLIPIILSFKKLWVNKDARIVLSFLVIALIGVYPRFSFFHFQTAFALIAILYSYLFYVFRGTTTLHSIVVLFLVIVFLLVHVPVFQIAWQREARFYTNDDLALAKVIKDKVADDERVYLFGLHSGLYPMANRLPPERWTDNFAWYLEIPGVQDEVVSRWEENPPKYVFWRTPSPGNKFDLGTYQPEKIVEWINNNYSRKEEVNSGVWLWESFDFAQDKKI